MVAGAGRFVSLRSLNDPGGVLSLNDRSGVRSLNERVADAEPARQTETRSTSSIVVRPCVTFDQPSSRSEIMPCCSAT